MPWAVIDFLLYLHDVCIRDVVEILFLGYVSSDEFVGILNCSLLPRAVGICEVDPEWLPPPDAQPLGDIFVLLSDALGGLCASAAWQPPQCFSWIPCLEDGKNIAFLFGHYAIRGN